MENLGYCSIDHRKVNQLLVYGLWYDPKWIHIFFTNRPWVDREEDETLIFLRKTHIDREEDKLCLKMYTLR